MTPSWQLLWKQGEQLHRLGRHKIHPEDKEPTAHLGPAPRPCSCVGPAGNGVPLAQSLLPPHCICRHTAQTIKDK